MEGSSQHSFDVDEIHQDSIENSAQDSSQDLEVPNIPRVVQVIMPGRAFQNPNAVREGLLELGFKAEVMDLEDLGDLDAAVQVVLKHNQTAVTKCLICEDNFAEDRVVVQDCCHAFCPSCTSSYLELKISEGQVLRFNCPHHECTNELSSEQVEAHIDEDLKHKLALFKRNEELSRNQNLRWRPRSDCQGYDIGSLQRTALKCNCCNYEYCYYCSEAPHGSKKCRAEADKLLDRWSRKN
jgi:hypothetical protein